MTGADKTALLIGAGKRFSTDVADRLRRDGYRVVATTADAAVQNDDPLDAIVINTAGAATDVGFLDLPDEAFVAGLEAFLDTVGALQAGMARLRGGGAIVALTTRGYLGAWGGADEMAFCGAMIGLMRSISLEDTPRGVRANIVACDFAPEDFGGDRREPPDQGERVAGAVAFFVGEDARAITGEVLLVNAGRGLQRRESQDRRARLRSNAPNS
jgi:NAD(P)-dependent dehydrogenase (short-subunit alcohol dehydrogenase family)